MYQYKPLIDNMYPKIADIKKAFKLADLQDIASVDTRPLYAIIDRISNNPRVNGMLNTRKTAITSFDWDIVPYNKNDLEKANEVKSLLRNNIRLILKYHTDIMLKGSLVFKTNWNNNNGNWVSKLQYISHNQHEKFNDTIYLRDENNNKSLIENSLDYIYTTDGNLVCGGILRNIIHFVTLIDLTLQEWVNLNNRMKGVVIGTLSGSKIRESAGALGINDAELESIFTNLKTAGEQLGTSNYLQTIEGIELQLSKLVEASAGTSFKTLKESLETDITIALLGQANTTVLPSSGGSRAALNVLNLIRSDIHFSDMNNITEFINTYLLQDFQLRYKKDADVCDWDFRFLYDDPSDVETYSRVYQNISSMQNKIPVSKTEFYKNLALEVPENDSFVLGGSSIGFID